MSLDTSTPVLLLGGRENSLAVTRHLGGLGIPVRVSGGGGTWGMHSRYCVESFPIPPGTPAADFWRDLLLSGSNGHLHGHMIVACNDPALAFLADHHQELEAHYLLDDAVPELQHAMLDKMRTLELGQAAGVAVPKFWKIDSAADMQRMQAEVTFPVMVKPLHTHEFGRMFGRKLFIIEDSIDELLDKIRLTQQHQVEVMVVEMIPGPDELLSSYYTYMDANGRELFHFTKRVLRRFPANRGSGCYHITEWLPETAEAGRKFFNGVGFRGFGNIEFKRDQRDGKLKVIEVNSRFTSAHVLVINAGAPLDLIVYCHVTGQSLPEFDHYEQFRRLWYPLRDFRAFRELSARGNLSLAGWLRSVMHRKTDFPIWSWRDPMPAIADASAKMSRLKQTNDDK